MRDDDRELFRGEGGESVPGTGVDCWKIERRPRTLGGIALAVVTRGELFARFTGGGVVGLFEGDCLRLPLGAFCELGGPGSSAELIVFRADAGWAATAMGLAIDTAPSALSAAAIDRAGSERARSSSRLLHDRLLPLDDRRRDPLRETAASFELLIRALEPAGSAGDDSPSAGARRARGLVLPATHDVRSMPPA